MKNIITTITLIALFAITNVHSQYTFMTNIQGQNGINADVTITFNNVVVNSSNCTNGFNYQIHFDYDVVYNQVGVGNGNSHLNTLQGYLACGSSNQSFFNLPNGGGTGSAMTANNWTSLTDCNNVQVQDVMCDEIDLVVQGPGVPYQEIRLQAVSSLPVEFISFTGNASPKGVLLNWSTASEKNNDYFTIEKSIDGKEWKMIAKVDGAGTTADKSMYQTTDKTSSSLVYYRLKQVDFDGTVTELKTIAVNNDYLSRISAYPNPAKDFIVVKGVDSINDIKIIDAMGVDQSNKAVVNDSNDGLRLNLIEFKNGVYFISTKDQQIKFIKY